MLLLQIFEHAMYDILLLNYFLHAFSVPSLPQHKPIVEMRKQIVVRSHKINKEDHPTLSCVVDDVMKIIVIKDQICARLPGSLRCRVRKIRKVAQLRGKGIVKTCSGLSLSQLMVHVFKNLSGDTETWSTKEHGFPRKN